MRVSMRWAAGLVTAVALGLAVVGCGDRGGAVAEPAAAVEEAPAAPSGARTVLASTVSFDADADTVTLPLGRGVGPDGDEVLYVVTESSDRADAERLGVTWAPKLANALGTPAVQRATRRGDTLRFAGTVDFAPERSVTPGEGGFPPATVRPGAVGDARYSPLVTTDGRVVRNASHLRNSSGTHDSVVAIDEDAGTVTLRTLDGFFEGAEVAYLRLDASVDVVAALEESTLAPRLGAAPGEGSNAPASARSAIVPIVNGVRAEGDPDRQGLQAAVLGGVSPRNITQSLPGAPDYSPVWDVTPAAWSDAAVAAGRRTLVTGNAQIARLVARGDLTSAGMGRRHRELGGLRALGAVSNCPTVAVLAG